MNITLSVSDIALCEAAAQSRSVAANCRGLANKKLCTKGSDLYIDILGAEGEAAVRLALGLSPEFVTWHGSDGGVGDLDFNGKSVQVKTTDKERGRLWFKKRKDFRADVAVLVIRIRPGFLRVAGWCSQKDFDAKHYMSDFGLNIPLEPVMDQASLRPIDTLEACIEAHGSATHARL